MTTQAKLAPRPQPTPLPWTVEQGRRIPRGREFGTWCLYSEGAFVGSFWTECDARTVAGALARDEQQLAALKLAETVIAGQLVTGGAVLGSAGALSAVKAALLRAEKP